jgi:hypothetical protein
MITLADAIQTLRPGVGFVIYDNDPKTIIWDDSKTTTPTDAEIQKAFTDAKAQEAVAIEAKAQAKTALLERLGITAEEAALLLG